MCWEAKEIHCREEDWVFPKWGGRGNRKRGILQPQAIQQGKCRQFCRCPTVVGM